MELAKLGFNICLISRNQQKLEAVAKEIEELARQANQKIETFIVKADFNNSF